MATKSKQLKPSEPRLTIFEWGDVKSLYLRTVRNGQIAENFPDSFNRGVVDRLIFSWHDPSEFYSYTSAKDVIEWLEKGYTLPGYQVEDINIAPLRKRKRVIYSDFEGEYMHDLFLSGADNYRLDFTKKERVPSVDILFDTSFTATTSGKVVAAYNRWLLTQLVDLEATGIDYSLRVVFQARNIRVDGFRDDTMDINHVIVKRVNEASDPTEWGALLSPGGFRQLMFLAAIKAAEMGGGYVDDGLGQPPRNTAFTVEHIGNQVIHIRPNNHGDGFSEARLTAQFLAAMNEAKL